MSYEIQPTESKYQSLMEQASDGIHTYDLDGKVIETNSKLCDMLGYSREELVRLNVADLVRHEDLVGSPIRFDELRSGQTVLSQRLLRRKDGTLVPVEISGKMLQEGILLAIIRDISERKRAEAELQLAYDQLSQRVAEQTAELRVTNEMLRKVMEELSLALRLYAPDDSFGRGRSQSSQPGNNSQVELSNREAQVLSLAAWGHSNKEIAAKLDLSVKTVETYKVRLMIKLDLKSRVEMVRYALRHGLLRDDFA